MVLLGIAAAGVLLPFASGASVQAEGVIRTLGAMLADDLIEQIVAVPYDSLVADYNYSEAQGQLKDSSGNILTDPIYANFSREVACGLAHVFQQSDEMDANFILVTVKVYYKGRLLATINRLISE